MNYILMMLTKVNKYFLCISLILLMKLSREACSPHMVHPLSLGTKNLFMYKILMHRKQVRLRVN
jgi:hypothetical protein